MGNQPTGGFWDSFNLWAKVPTFGPSVATGGSGTTNKKQAILFVAVLGGAFSKILYDYLTLPQTDIGPVPFIVALIGSVVTFPWIHKTAHLNKGELTIAKWCVAFQYGFFWPFAMKALTAVFKV